MWHFRSLRVGFLPLMTFLLWAAVREAPFHSGRCSLCKIRDAWDAGSRCASFLRNGDRSHSTSLPDANSFQAPSTAAFVRRQLPQSSGRLRTKNLQPALYVFCRENTTRSGTDFLGALSFYCVLPSLVTTNVPISFFPFLSYTFNTIFLLSSRAFSSVAAFSASKSFR